MADLVKVSDVQTTIEKIERDVRKCQIVGVLTAIIIAVPLLLTSASGLVIVLSMSTAGQIGSYIAARIITRKS